MIEKVIDKLFLKTSRTRQDEFPTTINQYLNYFEKERDIDFLCVLNPDFKFKIKVKSHKLNPFIQFAQPKDAYEISQMFKEAYNGTYPLKEMEDEKQIAKMINNPNFHWLIFKTDFYDTVGCFGIQLEFEKRRGKHFGFVIRRKYQGKTNIMNIFMGCFYLIWKLYKHKILVWHGEVRTAHNVSQYWLTFCGLRTIAFLPNKDIFFNRIESDFLNIIYDKKALGDYRSKNIPKIIKEVEDCFSYSNSRYKTSPIEKVDPTLSINPKKCSQLKKILRIVNVKNDFWYMEMLYTYNDSNSYFSFQYNSFVRNIEHVKYKVNNIEELYVFIHELNKFIRGFNIRYLEVFVSAYNPTHQKMFLEFGLVPCGYIPSWEYNVKQDFFEDYIIFSYINDETSDNIQVIPESEALLQILSV